MKKIAALAIAVLVALVILSFTKDLIIKTVVQSGAEMVTGLKLNMRSFNLGIIKTIVGIKGLRLFNPEGYPEKIMLDMPEIYVDYDLPAIITGKLHLEEMRIHLKQFNVIKNADGQLNLDSLKVVQAQKEGAKPKAKEKAKAPEIQIDSLELKIGKVIYKDYSKEPASVREFEINLHERYENVTDPYTLVSLIVVESLRNTTIARLANFDLSGLRGTVSDTLKSAQKIATGAVAGAQEAAKETVDALKKTTESLKDKLKLPFGE